MKAERLRLLLEFVADLSTHSLLEAELDELVRLAEIGKATEKAFEDGYKLMKETDENWETLENGDDVCMFDYDTIPDLLKWYKEEPK